MSSGVQIIRLPGAVTSIGFWTRAALALLWVLLLGFWGLGKSFGYLGSYPVLIGETMMLLIGLCLLMNLRYCPVRQASSTATAILLGVICAQAVYSWNVLRQPFIEVARGIAPFYYALLGLATYACLQIIPAGELNRYLPSKRTLNRLACVILLLLTASFISNTYYLDRTPTLPGTDIPIIYYKATDALMPIAIIILLWSEGLIGTTAGLWALGLGLIGSARSRSAMLGLILLGVLTIRFRAKFVALAGLSVVLIVTLLLLDVRVGMGYREISLRQYAANLFSLIAPDEAAEMDYNAFQNREWRRKWWQAIVLDSVNGPYLYIGRGWGSNLALDYGVVSTYDVATNSTVLRNPHNFFFSTLGRGGWIVALLWLLVHGVLVVQLVSVWRRARRHLPQFAFAARAGTAFLLVGLLQGSTDVFLESPQNAIPHWIVVGAAWYVLDRWRRASALLLKAQQLGASV